MWQAQRKAATKSGVISQYTNACVTPVWWTLSWSATASGSPSGRQRQKLCPYVRIDSATSWPTVRVSGGSGGGRSLVTAVSSFLPGRAKTEQAKDAGRPRTRSTWPTEDAGMRRFAAGQADKATCGRDQQHRASRGGEERPLGGA